MARALHRFGLALRGALASRVLGALILAAPVPALAARVPIAGHENPLWRVQHGLPLEYEDDAPIAPVVTGLQTTRAASTITFGPYTSFQVNVNAFGNDIVNDAANEPSLAVNPINHNQMVIGWRQFDNIASNFREAGVGYTANGGVTWTAGKVQAGVFRSDPVLATSNGGYIYYNSLTTYYGPLSTQVFRSYTGGTSWEAAVFAYGGDKQWMMIDVEYENLYQTWSVASNNYAPNTFNKSVDQGDTYSPPSQIPGSPVWGTFAADLSSRVYLVGWDVDSQGYLTDISVSRSLDAWLHDSDPPHFTTVPVDLGGFLNTGGPNPGGLLGQLWIDVDRSTSPRSGWVYVLASVETPTDPMDVNFIRSTDHGLTWSAPKRINDDPTGTRAFQWFGTMSVSPSGRIDAVWNDTRGSADSTISALYYSYSADGGVHWSPNVQVTPTWSSVIGFPNQSKIGDYYDMTSDDTGVDVAYAATFNGGEDIYYLRIPNTVTGVGDPQAAAPLRLDNAPNPFARGTTIRFDAPARGGNVRLEIFDLAGHRVTTLVDGFRTGAAQSIEWDGARGDGTQAPPGVYLCRLVTGGATETRKILRIR